MRGRFDQTMALAILFASVASVAGCSDPGPAVWEGDLVTVTSSDGVEICGETLDFLDRFAGHAYMYWTGEVPAWDLALELDLRVGDPSDQGGLATSSQGYAWTSANRGVIHELTHLVVGWDDGSSAPSLTEGVAESFGPGDPVALWVPRPPDPREFAFLPSDDFFFPESGLSATYYGPSAQLVAFLIDRFGVATVRSAYRAARHDQTAEEIEDALVSVLGDGLYDAFDEFQVAPQCALQAWECDSDIVPLRELPIVVEQDTDCTNDDQAVGAMSSRSELWFPLHQFVIDLPTETLLVIDTTDNALLRRVFCVETCDAEVWNAVDGDINSVEERVWGPGRIYVTVQPADPTKPFSASIRAAD